MAKAAEKIVRIEWQGPCCPSKIVSTASGVYQFYGWHPCYGDDSLLYIGKASNLQSRISQHEYLDPEQVPGFFRPTEIEVRWGIVADYAQLSLDQIEGILIFTHNPPWNSDSIRLLSFETHRGVIVENTGDYGGLVRKFKITKDDIVDLGRRKNSAVRR